MIIFLDNTEGHIQVYTHKGMETISFSNIERLAEMGEGSASVTYVTHVVDTTIDAVVNTVKALATQRGTPIAPSKKNKKVIKMVKDGRVYIPDLKTTLMGLIDYRIVDEQISTSPQVQQLIKKGILEIVSLDKAEKLKNEYIKKQAERQKQADKALEAILVDSSIGAKDAAKDPLSSGDLDVIEVDMTNDVKEERRIKKGEMDNEGSLLGPEDIP